VARAARDVEDDDEVAMAVTIRIAIYRDGQPVDVAVMNAEGPNQLQKDFPIPIEIAPNHHLFGYAFAMSTRLVHEGVDGDSEERGDE